MQEPLNSLGLEIHRINSDNGWDVTIEEDWLPDESLLPKSPTKIPAKLALMHSELSEALEAFRKGDRVNFAEELADCLIRILDCTAGLGIDMDKAVRDKLAVNKTRGYRHGGKIA